MDAADAAHGRVATEAAEVYEQFFVPALFDQWAPAMLRAAAVGAGDRVIDIGCGTGVLARAAARRVGPSGRVVGVDCNEGMLAVARRAPEPVAWHLGAAEHLAWPDASFDRVLSQFMLMFVDDPQAVADEMCRVLAPGGTVALATWAAVEESPGYASMVELLQRVVGDHAAEALRAPFGLGTVELVHEQLGAAFPEVAVARCEGTARFESIDAWVHTDIRGWTLAGTLDDDTYAELLAAARTDLAQYTEADGGVRFPAPALIASATKPR